MRPIGRQCRPAAADLPRYALFTGLPWQIGERQP